VKNRCRKCFSDTF